ncbi:MAG TPA: protein kinase [Thermoanaerobaculia bacterium]
MIGTTLGRYRILGELGRGAMGQVYLAQDLRLSRRVALKMLPPALVTDETRRKRFDRESRVLAALNHPNVVTIHAVEEEDGQPFLVMELIEGRSLAQLIPFGGLPLERWLDLAIPMVEGVAAAHRAGIVHRDLKPGNVMVRDDGVVKVVDFGISKIDQPETVADGIAMTLTEFHTAPGLTIGTLPYMSPQQLEGRPVDARSDIFSLGVILFEMATGFRPFQGASSASLISAILRDPPLLLPRTASSMPPEASAITDRCLAKDPADRFQSAEELRDALVELRRRALQGSVATRPREAAGEDSATLGAICVPTFETLTPGTAGSGETIMSGILVPSAAGTAPGAPSLPVAIPPRKFPWLSASLGLAVLVLVALLVAVTWRKPSPPAPRETPAPVAEAGVTSLAVLPLRNLSGDAAQDYFSDGTTEAIIGSLAKIGGLRISSRTSVMRFKNAVQPLPQIAKDLGVSYIVEGSAVRSGDRVRISVQLVDAARDAIIWNNAYERRMEDIFDVQNEVAEAVARETQGELTSTDLQKLAGTRAVRPEVYELYLKARFLLSKRSRESAQEALTLLDQALARDPGYAQAWASKADCYVLLVSFGMAAMPTEEGLPKARQAARRALELDPNLSEAHALLGVVELGSWNWTEAEEHFQRAIALNPSNADAYHRYTQLLSARGDHERAIAAIQKAQQLDPLSPPVHTAAAANYYYARRYEDCMRAARRVLELQPGSWAANLFLGAAHSRLGHAAEAEKYLKDALQGSKENPFVLGSLGRHYARIGKKEEARKVLADLERRSRTEYVAASLPAKLYFLLGDPDRGFVWMDKAFAERDQSLNFLKVDPDYDPVRNDPRFQRLLERIGLGKAAPAATAG